MRLAVIGGGLSGLTAAFYLHRLLPQAELQVFEAADRVGGVISTERRDGWLLECGADCFSVTPPDALRLCQDMGLEDQLIAPQQAGRLAMISRGNRLVPVPEGFVLMRPTRVWQVIKSPLLSWSGKARLAFERFVPKRTEEADESLASFVRRRLGQESLDRIVQPLVGGIYTADAERLSMQATMPQFVRMEKEFGSLIGAKPNESEETRSIERETSGARYGQFRVFPEGMGRLFDEIQSRLPKGTLRLGTAVKSLTKDADGRWRVEVEGDSGPVVFDGVVAAVPTAKTARLLEHLSAGAAELLRKIEYASSAIVLLGVKTDQIKRLPVAFGFVCPAADKRQILAASFASHKFPGRTPAGCTLIRVFIGGAVQPELLAKSDTELIEIAKSEMRDLIGMTGAPELVAVQRWNEAMPQYHVGHKQLVAEIDRAIGGIAGLEICGNGLHGVGIAPVVGCARRAAERLVAGLEAG